MFNEEQLNSILSNEQPVGIDDKFVIFMWKMLHTNLNVKELITNINQNQQFKDLFVNTNKKERVAIDYIFLYIRKDKNKLNTFKALIITN